MEYSFDIEIAEKYGVNEAIMIRNLVYWITKNKANNKHFYDGRTWTYNSMKAFAELFPFWSRRQIERILKSLIKQKVIVKGNYNKVKYDQTSWYAFLDNSICVNGETHFTECVNGNTQMVKPIPDINTDINTDKEDGVSQEVKPIIKKKVLSDEEWIESLKGNKAYEGLDIDKVHGRLLAWCEVKGKKPTRARLLNWLNREERPMTGKSKHASAMGMLIKSIQEDEENAQKGFKKEGL